MYIIKCLLQRTIRRGTEAVITAPTRNRMELERAHVGSNPTSSVFFLLFLSLFSMLVFPLLSQAAGFQLFEVDTAGLGNFHAGGAAEANGASSEYFNPAGMVRIKRPEISFGDTLISSHINYQGFVKGPVFSGVTPPGGVSSNALSNVPNFHLAIPLNSRFTFAFGATTPFGLETEFPEGYPKASSQAATFSRLLTMNLNPSMAFLINRYFSIAAGLDWIYTKVNYNNVVASPIGITNFKNNVDGWGSGYNLGGLLMLTPNTRLGLSYRSGMVSRVAGSSTLENVRSTHGSAQLNLPSMTVLSAYHDVNSKLALMASAFYTKWDVFSSILLNNTPFGNVLIRQDYHNSWTYAVGANYVLTQTYTLKAGFGIDESPTRTGFRDIRLPDANRYYTAVGLHIQPEPRIGFDVGYAHVFFNKARVDNTQQVIDSGGLVALQLGSARTSANVFGFQATFTI